MSVALPHRESMLQAVNQAVAKLEAYYAKTDENGEPDEDSEDSEAEDDESSHGGEDVIYDFITVGIQNAEI